MNEGPNGARVAIEALQREGVRYIFGLPGTTIMHLLDALAQQKEIHYISTRHEQVAAFMMDEYVRRSGVLGVCIASRGLGAANMTIRLHNSYAESVPVMALLEQVADEGYYREVFEKMNLAKVFDHITNWSLRAHNARHVPELVQRAVRTCLGSYPCIVMVFVPLDVQIGSVPAADSQTCFRHRRRSPWRFRLLREVYAHTGGYPRPELAEKGRNYCDIRSRDRRRRDLHRRFCLRRER